jgi:hypothetical protein
LCVSAYVLCLWGVGSVDRVRSRDIYAVWLCLVNVFGKRCEDLLRDLSGGGIVGLVEVIWIGGIVELCFVVGSWDVDWSDILLVMVKCGIFLELLLVVSDFLSDIVLRLIVDGILL